MPYTNESLIKLLYGKWNRVSSKSKHYLFFYRKKGMDTFKSKHRRGTFQLKQTEDGVWVLELSSAAHERVLEVIDRDHITMKIDSDGDELIYNYKRDKNIIRNLLCRLKK